MGKRRHFSPKQSRFGNSLKFSGAFSPSYRIRTEVRTHLSHTGIKFWGLVALNVTKALSPARMVLLSPVPSFSAIKGVETLGAYVRTFYPGAYRFEENRWAELLQDKILEALPPLPEKIAKSTLVIAGDEDPQIPFTAIQTYTKEQHMHLMVKKGIGHLSLSRIGPVREDIATWLNGDL